MLRLVPACPHAVELELPLSCYACSYDCGGGVEDEAWVSVDELFLVWRTRDAGGVFAFASLVCRGESGNLVDRVDRSGRGSRAGRGSRV